ncbi:hypothetical protein QTP88_022694 [Uroleucon formosanum]
MCSVHAQDLVLDRTTSGTGAYYNMLHRYTIAFIILVLNFLFYLYVMQISGNIIPAGLLQVFHINLRTAYNILYTVTCPRVIHRWNLNSYAYYMGTGTQYDLEVLRYNTRTVFKFIKPLIIRSFAGHFGRTNSNLLNSEVNFRSILATNMYFVILIHRHYSPTAVLKQSPNLNAFKFPTFFKHIFALTAKLILLLSFLLTYKFKRILYVDNNFYLFINGFWHDVSIQKLGIEPINVVLNSSYLYRHLKKYSLYTVQYLYIGIRVPIHFVFNVDDEMAPTTVELCKYVLSNIKKKPITPSPVFIFIDYP